MLPERSACVKTQQELRVPGPQQLLGRHTSLAPQPEPGRAPGALLDVCQWHGVCVHFFPGWGGGRSRWRSLERLTEVCGGGEDILPARPWRTKAQRPGTAGPR